MIIFQKMPVLKGFIMIFVQFVAIILSALTATGCYMGSLQENVSIFRPKRVFPEVSILNVILTEMVLTAILVFVVFGLVVNPPKVDVKEEDQIIAKYTNELYSKVTNVLAIGFTLGFLAFLGISSSSGVFNPAIIIAPVLLSWTWVDSWAYLEGQFIGSIIGGGLQSACYRNIVI